MTWTIQVTDIEAAWPWPEGEGKWMVTYNLLDGTYPHSVGETLMVFAKDEIGVFYAFNKAVNGSNELHAVIDLKRIHFVRTIYCFGRCHVPQRWSLHEYLLEYLVKHGVYVTCTIGVCCIELHRSSFH